MDGSRTSHSVLMWKILRFIFKKILFIPLFIYLVREHWSMMKGRGREKERILSRLYAQSSALCGAQSHHIEIMARVGHSTIWVIQTPPEYRFLKTPTIPFASMGKLPQELLHGAWHASAFGRALTFLQILGILFGHLANLRTQWPCKGEMDPHLWPNRRWGDGQNNYAVSTQSVSIIKYAYCGKRVHRMWTWPKLLPHRQNLRQHFVYVLVVLPFLSLEHRGREGKIN